MGFRITPLLLMLISAVSLRAAPPPGFEPSGYQWFPCSVVRYSHPLKLSGTIGAIHMRLLPDGGYRGFFVQLEPGAGGGKITGGYRIGKTQLLPLYSLGIGLSFMRTWGDPLGDVESGQSYLGAEAFASFAGIWLNGGVFRHVAGGSENEYIYSMGVAAGI